MGQPKVSICIPTYNYGRFLPEAVQSVLRQNYADFEILVIDNCSTDNTRDVMEQYCRSDSRIRYILNPENVGMVRNWNYCIREARGAYIKFLFSDDLLITPDALAKMVAVLDSNPTVSLVGSARRIIDENSRESAVWAFSERDIIIEGAEIIRRTLMLQKNQIGEPSAVMFRKSQAERGFDEKFQQIVDMEMWYHLLEQGSFAFLSEPLCAFRIHEQQQSNQNAKIHAGFDDMLLLLNAYINKKYLKFSTFYRYYQYYDLTYQYWKAFRKHKTMSREKAFGKVSEYGFLRFFLLFPVYKAVKPFRKLCLSADKQ